MTVTDTAASIAETAANSAAVVDVDNTGDDDITSLVWTIASGNTDGDSDGELPFAINSGTGAITVNDADDLDFETTTSYDLTVQVSDGASQTDTEVITITITDVAPTVTDTSANLAESAADSAAVVTVSTTGDDESLTWSITNGNTDGDGDGELPFAIGASTGAITVNDADDLDFETTTSYDLTVQATDGTTADTEVITITITDVAPTVTDTSANLAESASANAAVVTVSTTGDDESLTWSITAGNTDGDSDGQLPFAIGASTGAITVNDADDLDFETTTSYTLTVRATDGTAADTEDITITITDVNDNSPVYSSSATTKSIQEFDEGSGSAVDTVSITDADASNMNSNTCTLGGNDANDFTCTVTASQYVLAFSSSPDYENPTDSDADNVYSVTVTISDGDNSGSTISYSLTITDYNDETPTYSSSDTTPDVVEGQTAVETITITDADALDTNGCILGGADADDFSCTISATQLVLAFATAPDYDSPSDADSNNIYAVTVTVFDGTQNGATISYQVSVTNINDDVPQYSSSDLTPSINEGTNTVETVAITDPDNDDVNSCILGGADASDFYCLISSDQFVLAFSSAPDYESPSDADGNNVYLVTVTISDSFNTGATLSYQVSVADINDNTPSYSSSDTTPNVNEGTTTVETVTINNVDTGIDENACTLAGADAEDFTCTASATQFVLAFANAPDYEAPSDAGTNNVYEVTVTISDGTNSGSTISYTVTVDDVAIAIPQSQTGSVSEAANADTTVMTVTTSGDTAQSFSIASGNDDGIFAISNAGVISIASTTNLDYETTPSYTITITGVAGSSTDTEAVTISIGDANDQTPSYSAGNAAPDVAEGTTAVDTDVAITDTDTGDQNTCALGGADAASFTCTVSSTAYSLAFSSAADFEGASADGNDVYTVTVTINDGAQNGPTVTYTVTVTDVDDEAPVFTSSAAISMAENVQNVVTLTVTDADSSEAPSYTLSGTDSDLFEVSSGTLRFASSSGQNYESMTCTANPCVVIVTATDTSGNVATQTVSITITDQDEFNVTAPTDSDSDSNTLSEDVSNGASAEITATASDADGTTNTVTYDITSQTCSGAFAIGESTGIVTVADTGAIDYETSDSCDLTVRATSADSSTSSTTFTVAITDVDDVAPVFTSSDSITLNENVQNVVSLSVTDADTSAAPTYTLSGTDSALFEVNSGTLRFASSGGQNFESMTCASNPCAVTVTATDAGGNAATQSVSVTIADVNEFDVSTPTDSDGDTNTLAEDVSNGASAEITASASDADGSTNTVSYAITAQSCSGAFEIDSSSGAITVADTSAIDYDTAQSCTITVTATSADSSTAEETFTVTLTDVNDQTPTYTSSDTTPEIEEGNTAVETVAITDTDTGDSNTCALAGQDSSLFTCTVDATQYSLAFTTAPDFENPLDGGAGNTYVVYVTISDGTNTGSMIQYTITVTDKSEFTISDTTDSNAASNTVSEGASDNAEVGITATATDDDSGDSVTYTMQTTTTACDGWFDIGSSDGIVRVDGSSELDYETVTSCVISVTSTSSDTSTSTEDFTITLTDVNEHAVTSPTDTDTDDNTLAENVANGASAEITAAASDSDGTDNTVTFGIASQTCTGAFTIAGSTGVVTVSDTSAIDYETATTCYIVVRATSADGSTADTNFSVSITDIDEFDVTAPTDSNSDADSLSENATANALVGITASASDDDGSTNAVTYAISSQSCTGAFAIDSGTGAISVADASAIDYETAETCTVTVLATSQDQSTASTTFSVSITDEDEADVSTPTDSDGDANEIPENSADGASAHITVLASDSDGTTNAVTYQITEQSCTGLLAVDATTGIVTVADNSGLDAETTTSCTVTVEAASADGSTAATTFTVTITDVDDTAPVFTSDSSILVNENVQDVVDLTVTDADSTAAPTYTLSGTDSSLFEVSSGTLRFASASGQDFESITCTSNPCVVVVTATDAGGNTADQTVVVSIVNVDDEAPTFTSSSAVSVDENSQIVHTVTTDDLDSNSASYIVFGGTDSALFSIDGTTGALTFTEASGQDFESITCNANPCEVVIRASDTAGNTADQTISISVTDVNEHDVSTPVDSDSDANEIAESAANGTEVQITVSASDADGSNNGIAYDITSQSCAGAFAVDASSGIVTVADTTAVDFETASTCTLTARATSDDGSTESATFTVTITDTNEIPVQAPTDSDGASNEVSEAASQGDSVGITAVATDGDTSDSVTYAIASQSCTGAFQISDDTTGVVTVADPTALDYESSTTCTIGILATSTDGSTAESTFTVGILDSDEFDVTKPVDANDEANTVSEDATTGTKVGVVVSAVDADGTTNAVTYAITAQSCTGAFSIDSGTGVVSVGDSTALDFDTSASCTLTVEATSADGSADDETFTVSLTDVNDQAPVYTPTDASPTVTEGDTAVDNVQITDTDTGDTNTCSLSGQDSSLFTCTVTESEYTLAFTNAPDFENPLDAGANNNYLVYVTISDGTNTGQTAQYSVDVADANESAVGATTDVNSAANSVAENAADGSEVGITALATDDDGSDGVTYSMTADTTDCDGWFNIGPTDGIVSVADSLAVDFETAATCTLTVTSLSDDGSTSTASFDVQITDYDEFDVTQPVDDNDDDNEIPEDATAGTSANITASSSDADGTTNAVTYSIVSQTCNGAFSIDSSSGDVSVASTSAIDYEVATTCSIAIRATSADGSTADSTFVVEITDVNDVAPQYAATDANPDVSEGTTSVDTLAITDEDSTGSYACTLTGDDSLLFTCVVTGSSATLAFQVGPDYEYPSDDDGDNVYHVSLSISDGTADGGQVDYAVTVTDDPPEGVLSISGDAYDGATLTADTSQILDSDGSAGTFQWNRDGAIIAGETGSSYTIGDCCEVLGSVYSVTITYTDLLGTIETLTSANTAPVTLNPAGDLDDDGILNSEDNDIDGDGANNSVDQMPYDASESVDTDGDGIGDNADTDDDNDGIEDSIDLFPLDATETTDADGDGIGDNADTDDDNDGLSDADEPEGCQFNADCDADGILDSADAFPVDATENTDTDGDGTGDNADTDDDNDGTLDADDAFPMDPAADTDTDGDGQPDDLSGASTTGLVRDTDDDGDGIPDLVDAFPLDVNESVDTDNDGVGNNADNDDDNDGVEDAEDAFPNNAGETRDSDGDGTGDNADTDDDNDGVSDVADAFPLDANETADSDNDGTGDNADTDDDNDGVSDDDDPFPNNAGESRDADGDGIGDNADNDDDNDGVIDVNDEFPEDPSESKDTDGDGTGDNADTDDDNDGALDEDDAFPLDPTESVDTDGDGIGDNADTDADGDGVADDSEGLLEDLESQENFILLLAAGLLIVALIAILAIITLLKVLQRLDQDGDGDFDMDDVKILGRRLMGSDKIDETMRKK